MIAYWSQLPPGSPKGGDEVDVYFAGSIDGGAHWTPPTRVNPAGTNQENSYPSAATLDENHAILIWLDGRMWEKEKRDMLMQARVSPMGLSVDPPCSIQMFVLAAQPRLLPWVPDSSARIAVTPQPTFVTYERCDLPQVSGRNLG